MKNKNNNFKFLSSLLVIMIGCIIMIGCTKEKLVNQERDEPYLEISVNTVNSKSLKTGMFDSGDKIGVAITDAGGVSYDALMFNNECFLAVGDNDSQLWQGDALLFSSTNGYLTAYYPFDNTVTELTNIPVYSGNTDYMYSGIYENLNQENYSVSLEMKHALACVRFNISKGSYSGTGNINQISITGNNIGAGGYLNSKTGAISLIYDLGETVSMTDISENISTVAKSYDFIVVHNSLSAELDFVFIIDDKEYRVTKDAYVIEQNYVYEYTVVLNDAALTVGLDNILEWGYEDAQGSITTDSYQIELTGDTDKISFNQSTEGDTVIIKATTNDIDTNISLVNVDGNASVSEEYDFNTNIYTYTVANLSSNLNLEFTVYTPLCVSYTINDTGFYPIEIYSNNDSWQVNFGDGNTSETGLTMSQILEIEHEYADGLGEYTIKYYNSSDDAKITGIYTRSSHALVAFTKCDYDCSQVTDLSYAFYYCSSLVDISGLSSFTEVTSLIEAFDTCESLTDISALSNMTQITDLSYAFRNCSSLTDISGLSNMTQVTDLSYAFRNCSSLTDISALSNMTQVTDLSYAFYGCTGLTDISALSNMTQVTDLSYAFSGCTGLTDISGLSNMTQVTDLSYAFRNCSSLTDISALSNMTQVTDLSYAFYGCTGLTDISALSNMTQVTDLSYAFYQCSKLISISGLGNMTKAYNLYYSFAYCTNLNSVASLSNMTDVIYLDYAFYQCKYLTDITALSGMTDIMSLAYAFSGCSSLTNAVKWWDSTTYNCIRTLGNYCYVDCTNITSPFLYSEIPSGWK